MLRRVNKLMWFFTIQILVGLVPVEELRDSQLSFISQQKLD